MDIKNNFTTKTKKLDPIDAVLQFQIGVLNKKPSTKVMIHDIQMSSLKIRPHAGDIFSLNVADRAFIENLWSIIKLEEYILKITTQIKKSEEKIFFNLVNNIRRDLNNQINQIDIRLPHLKKQTPEPIAIEIFRDMKRATKRSIA